MSTSNLGFKQKYLNWFSWRNSGVFREPCSVSVINCWSGLAVKGHLLDSAPFKSKQLSLKWSCSERKAAWSFMQFLDFPVKDLGELVIHPSSPSSVWSCLVLIRVQWIHPAKHFSNNASPSPKIHGEKGISKLP